MICSYSLCWRFSIRKCCSYGRIFFYGQCWCGRSIAWRCAYVSIILSVGRFRRMPVRTLWLYGFKLSQTIILISSRAKLWVKQLFLFIYLKPYSVPYQIQLFIFFMIHNNNNMISMKMFDDPKIFSIENLNYSSIQKILSVTPKYVKIDHFKYYENIFFM